MSIELLKRKGPGMGGGGPLPKERSMEKQGKVRLVLGPAVSGKHPGQ